MPVKRSRSAARVLSVLECIAQHQPAGVSELAEWLGDDKSAVQRALMTLADEGWICAAPGKPTRWQLTAHILTIAHTANISNDLRARARPSLQALREATGETVLLSVPDEHRFVVIDVLESQQMLRTVPHIGMVVPAFGSATSRAILAYLSPADQLEMLGEPADAATRRHFAMTLKRGYSVSEGDVFVGSTNIAAPIIESDGRPVAAVVVSAPSDRLQRSEHARIGGLVLEAARCVSRDAGQSLAQASMPGEKNYATH